jgi:hypothetical protein
MDKACLYTAETRVALARTPIAIDRKKNRTSDVSPMKGSPDAGKWTGI